MKTIKKARLLLFSLMVGSGAALAQNVDLHWTSPEKERYVTFYAEPQGKPPEEMSYMIAPVNPDPKFQTDWEKEAQTNHHLLPLNWDVGFNIFDEYKEAVWVPFKTNMLVDLGPGDGGRWLWVGFRMKGDEKPYRVGNGIATNIEGGNWDAHHIILQTLPPTVVITAPKPGITSQPMVQLKGYVTSDMDSVLRFDVFNQNGAVTGSGEAGFDNRSEDSDRWAYVENYFQCLDIQLSPGTNTIVLSGTDSAGFQFKTNFVCVFTTVGATNPPVFSVTWPQDGTSISGAQFDLYGRCDEDPTAVITGLLTDDEGKSSHLNGFVERNGCLWIERVPVENGKNYLTIVATDAANNSSVTNLTFTKNSLILYMDAVADPNQLWQPRITVTGFCSDTNRTVTVSGVRATMKSDGHWVAKNVPVNSPNGGGTATFDIATDEDGKDFPPTNAWLPTICGPVLESNAISAGLSLTAVSTNEYNHYAITLGLTNTSGHNIAKSWMLPGSDARFALRLYDSADKEVAKQEWMGKSGQTLATNLNIHHLGKDELNSLDGIISFLTNSTSRVASFNLDEHFQLPPTGDYRLEVTLRMFEIAPDGRLIPFEFPTLVTPIRIIDQPSEMVFYLNDLFRQGKLTWGAERDGMRVGVAHGMKWTRIQDANQIQVFLQNNSTNDYRNWNLRFPNTKEQFVVALYDASGKEVPRTDLGKQQGQPLSLDGQNSRPSGGLMEVFFGNNHENFRRTRPVFIAANDATECGRFNLNDDFEIATPGKYRLTYQERLYRLNTNSILTGVILPIVNVPLEINYIPEP